MHPKKRKALHKIAAGVLTALFLGAAISPSFAATQLASDLFELDRGTWALVATFTILLLAIVIEVWRLTRRKDMPRPHQSRDSLHRLSHE